VSVPDYRKIIEKLIEDELGRLARSHQAPEAFEALCWVRYQARHRVMDHLTKDDTHG